MTPTDRTAELRARVSDQFPALTAELEALVRIPSVSSPAFDQAHVAASAAAVAELFTGAGLEAEILSSPAPDGTPGRPAVVARRPAPPGAPTVLLYAHHDVQPPGGAWTTDPFEPVERDGRMFGRGTGDDKAGVMVHLGALRVLAEELRVGVTVFVEGEEEIGSPSFGAFVREHRDRLAADVIVVTDSANWKVGVPALTTTLRGLVDCQVEVAVASHELHSGVYGGPVLDAPTLMARLLATLHDDAGDVAVAGLVSGPEPDVDYPEADLRADAGVLDGVVLAGTGSLAGRLWTKPALSVIGMDVTSVDQASNTIAPRCRARLSLRIAPGQEPAAAFEALRAHLAANAPFGAEVTVTLGDQGRAFRSPEDSPAMRLAREALSDAWAVPAVDIGIGGSIPFVPDLAEVFPDAAILVTGVLDPDSRAHGSNESVHLGDLANAVLAEALLLDRLV